MSARCTAAVFDRYPAGGGEFTLALALADNAHEDGTHIYPSVDTMAAKSRQDVRSVQRHLKRMQAAGWLILVRAAAGRGRPAEYRISPRWLKGDSLSPIHAPVDNSPMGDTVSPIRAAKRVTSTTQKGDNWNSAYIEPKEPNTPLPPKGGEVEEKNNSGTKAEFDTLVAAYPAHRRNVGAAWTRWCNLKPDAQLQARMLRAVSALSCSQLWQAQSGKAVPNLSKWLLNEGWQAVDEAPVARAPAPTPAPTPAPSAEVMAANKARAQQLLAVTRAAVHARQLGVPA